MRQLLDSGRQGLGGIDCCGADSHVAARQAWRFVSGRVSAGIGPSWQAGNVPVSRVPVSLGPDWLGEDRQARIGKSWLG